MKLLDRFDVLGRTAAPDLWPGIEHRELRPAPPLEPGRRAASVAVALVVSTVAIAFAAFAFIGAQDGRPVREPGATTAVPTVVDLPGPGVAVTYGAGSEWVAVSNNDGSFGGHVLRLDPDTAAAIADIPVPTVPTWEVGGGGLAFGDGSIWVIGAADAPGGPGAPGGGSDALLVRIDPAAERVVGTIELGGTMGADVSVDEHGVWALIFVNGEQMSVVRVDATTNSVSARIAIPASYAHYVFAHGGNVIVAAREVDGDTVGDTVLFSVDPSTNEVMGNLPLRSPAWPAMDDEGRLWLATGHRLLTVNSARLNIDADVALRATGDALAADASGVWFLDPVDRAAVHRYNTAMREVDLDVELPKEASSPVALGVSPGVVWILDYDHKLVRIGLS